MDDSAETRAQTALRVADWRWQQWSQSLSWTAVPLAIGIASRAFSILLLAVAGVLQDTRRIPWLTQWRNPFVAWDGQWYLRIATEGYHALPIQGLHHHDVAFFPGWPLLMRVAGLFDLLPIAAVSVVLANALAVLAFVLIWRALADRFTPATATGATALLAFSPAAFVMSMAYSEPLFLVLVAVAFLSVDGRVRVVATALSLVTRVTGVALVAAAAARLLVDRTANRRYLVLSGVAAAAALGVWMAAVGVITRDPLGFFHDGSANWYPLTGIHALANAVRHPQADSIARIALMALMGLGTLYVLRRDLEMGVYAVTCLALALLPGALMASYPRYALVAFPALAGVTRVAGKRGTVLLVVLFACFQVYLVYLAFVPIRVTTP